VSIGFIIFLTFVGFVTAMVLLLGREFFSILFLIFLAILTVLGFLFAFSLITLQGNMALVFFILILIFLNLTFFLVYFIPIGVVGRKFSLPATTVALIIINTLIFAITRPETNPKLYEGLILKFENINVITVFASMFHHANIYHLLGNMLFLWIFGSYLEDRIGWRRMLKFYFLTGLMATFGQLFFTILSEPETWSESGILGASGAISGVMGVFLIRCRQTKIRFIPNPYIIHLVGFPKLNATLFVGLCFLTDLLIGYFVLTGEAYTRIGVFAHATGLLTGVLLGRAKDLMREARIEGLFLSALEDIQEQRYTTEVETKLTEVVSAKPDFAEAHLHLARMFSREKSVSQEGNPVPDPRGKEHYEKAIRLYLRSSWRTAGEVFREYFKSYRQPLSDIQLHLKATKALIRLKDYDLAERTLEAVTKLPSGKSHTIEEAYLLRGRILDEHLGFQEAALHVYDEFLKRFPDSQFKDTVIGRCKKIGAEVI